VAGGITHRLCIADADHGYRSCAVKLSAISQLAKGVSPPALHCATCAHNAVTRTNRTNCNSVANADNRYWSSSGLHGTVVITELALVVASPAFGRTICQYCTAVKITNTDFDCIIDTGYRIPEPESGCLNNCHCRVDRRHCGPNIAQRHLSSPHRRVPGLSLR